MGNFSDVSPAIIKAHFVAHILDAIQPDYADDDESDKAKLQWAWDRFNAEYNYPENKARLPNYVGRVESWLQGLSLDTSFTYADIIQLQEEWHGFELSKSQQDAVCERWFPRLAMTLTRLWRDNGIGEAI
jgi:hypothetical protein